MTSLTLLLSLVLIVTFVLFVLINIGPRSSTEKVSKRLFIIYAWIVCVSLSFAILHFIGIRKSGTQVLGSEKQRLLKYLGYYISPRLESEFVLTGSAQEHAFLHDALSKGERIALKPIWDPNTNKANTWKLSYIAGKYPLRIAGRCINVMEENWLASNDSFFAYLTKNNQTRFFSIKYEARTTWTGAIENYYYYSQGLIQNGELRYAVKDILLSSAVLKEGRNLSVILRLSSEGFKQQVGNIDQDWWEVFEGITLVREKLDQRQSRIGLLLADALFANPNLQLAKNTILLQTATAEREEYMPFDSAIFYGLGYKDSLSVRLSNELVSDQNLGEVLDILFTEPQSWSLPPRVNQPFILTSSNDYIPLDGYLFNIGNIAHPFYAKAIFRSAEDLIEVNDGHQKLDCATGGIIRLGDFNAGILISLGDTQPAVSYTGCWAIGFLILWTALFSLITWTEPDSRLKLDCAWTMIWGLLLTILVVRLILAYRVSLFPPNDATPKQIENVFDKALIVSLWFGIAILPLILLSARYFSRFEVMQVIKRAFIKYKFNPKPIVKRFVNNSGLFLIWAVPVLWILAGKVFGNTESLFGLRINIVAHILIILCLAVTTKMVLYHERLKDKILILSLIMTIILLMIFVINDNGFIIYTLSFVIFALPLLLWDKQSRLGATIWTAAVIFVVALPFFSAPLLIKIPWIKRVANPLLPENVFYRVVSNTETENLILLARSDESRVGMDLLLRNSHQNWQMLLYAAEGIREPKGYGQAPLSDRGMSYPTSMADCVYSIYILSEHGLWTGFLLVLIYLALSFTCFYASWHFFDEFQHRGLILVAIGAFFACNTLFIAAANVGLVPFTGQNIPLLSLYSQSDLLHGAILTIIATVLLRSDLFQDADESLDGQPAVMRAEVLILVSLAIWSILLLSHMHSIGRNENYIRDHNLTPEVYEAIQKNIPDPERPNTAWHLDGETLVKQPGSKVPDIVEQLVNQFNERANKFDPIGGAIYLEATHTIQGPNTVRINLDYFKVRSPFRDSSLWNGLITARSDKNDPTVSALGYEFTVSLADSGHAASIPLAENPPVRANRVVLITETNKADSPVFCELIRKGDELFLEPRRGNWKIYVEGNVADSSLQLKPYDIIVIEKGNLLRRNLMYLGIQPPILAFVKWRNGEYQRIFPRGELFPLAFAIGKAGDRAAVLGEAPPDTLMLTIDVPLQNSLNRNVSEYANQNPHYNDTDLTRVRRLALTVMDAFSGEILAVPSWPSVNPNDARIAEYNRGATAPLQARLLNNYNLTNHAIGSTIKPLVFASLAAQFWPEVDLADLVVANRADTQTPNLVNPLSTNPIHLHSKIAKIPIEAWDCYSSNSPINEHNFIVNSLDFYQGFIGMLGALLKKEDWQSVLVANRQAWDIEYRGQNYIVDLTRVPESSFSLSDPLPRPRAQMDNTLLFKGLPILFEVDVSENSRQSLAKISTRFLPSFHRDSFYKNEYISKILPEPINFRPRDFQSIRKDYISFLLGAGASRWNNVSMTEAAARLLTGRRVTATLERAPHETLASDGNPQGSPASLPLPIGEAQWRYKNLILPMKQAAEVGTASRLRGSAPAPYVLLCKTGTINERENGRESETLLFVIGQWGKNGFVSGKTLACFFYMQDSKEINGQMRKFDFALPIIDELIRYLKKAP
jgi:hypothetical protein